MSNKVALWAKLISAICLFLLGETALVAGIEGTRPEVIEFKASPYTPAKGDTVTLRWKVSKAESVKITPDIGVVEAEGKRSFTVEKDQVFTLLAQNGTLFVSVELPIFLREIKPTISYFSAKPMVILRGEAAVLSWHVSDCDYASLDNGLGMRLLDSSVEVRPKRDTTYTLRAGTAIAKVTVNVVEDVPKIIDFRVARTTVERGDKVLLSWQVDNVKGIRISNLSSKTLPAKGSALVPVNGDTTFILSAGNGRGQVRTSIPVIAVEPAPRIVVFEVLPKPVIQGQSATLRWKVDHVEEVVLGNGFGRREPAGELVFKSETDMDVELTATNDQAVVREVLKVQVKPAPPLFIAFDADPPVVMEGGQVKIQWMVENADYVTFVNEQGNKIRERREGNRYFKLSVSNEFVMTASGKGGDTTRSITLKVIPGKPKLNVVSTILSGGDDPKQSGQGILRVGSRLHYRVTVINNGTGLADRINLAVRDERGDKRLRFDQNRLQLKSLAPGEMTIGDFSFIIADNPCQISRPDIIHALNFKVIADYSDGAGNKIENDDTYTVNEMIYEPCIAFNPGKPTVGYPLRDVFPSGNPEREHFIEGDSLTIRLHNTGIRNSDRLEVFIRPEIKDRSYFSSDAFPKTYTIPTIRDRSTYDIKNIPMHFAKGIKNGITVEFVVDVNYYNDEGKRFSDSHHLSLFRK